MLEFVSALCVGAHIYFGIESDKNTHYLFLTDLLTYFQQLQVARIVNILKGNYVLLYKICA